MRTKNPVQKIKCRSGKTKLKNNQKQWYASQKTSTATLETNKIQKDSFHFFQSSPYTATPFLTSGALATLKKDYGCLLQLKGKKTTDDVDKKAIHSMSSNHKLHCWQKKRTQGNFPTPHLWVSRGYPTFILQYGTAKVTIADCNTITDVIMRRRGNALRQIFGLGAEMR